MNFLSYAQEFYTPLHPRSLTFVHQCLQDNLSRSLSDATGVVRPSPHGRGRGSRHSMSQQRPPLTTVALDPQLTLFVVFEKKVGLIRLFNSAVGDVTLFEEPAPQNARELGPSSSVSSSTLSASSPGFASLSGRRSRTSLDGFGLTKDNRGAWTLPAKLDLPRTSTAPSLTATTSTGTWDTATLPATTNTTNSNATGTATATRHARSSSSPGVASIGESAAAAQSSSSSSSIYVVTRGKQTFVLPCPLPANLQSTAPLLVLPWRSHPTFVSPRVIDIEYPNPHPTSARSDASYDSTSTAAAMAAAAAAPPVPARRRVLQLTAFGEDGLEIQEVPLSSLFGNGNGKGKERWSRYDEPVVSEVDIGETGFLCGGGHWHRPYDAPLDLSRSFSMRSGVSFDSMATEEVILRLEADQGTYGWQRKGLEDWRVFWIGGAGDESRTDDD